MFTYEMVFTIVHLCDILCGFYCIHRILTPRPQVSNAYLCSLTVLLVSPCYEIFTGDVRSFTRYFLFIISWIIPALLFYQDKLLRKICAFLFSSLLALFSEVFFASTLWPVLQTIFRYPYSSINLVPKDKVGALCLYIVPVTIIECFITYNGHKIWYYFHLNFNLLIVFEISISPLLFASGIPGALILDHALAPIFLLFMFLAVNLLFLKGVKDLAANMKKARNNQLMKKNLELLLSDYEAMEQQNLSIRLKNHDIANHLRTVEYLISENQVDEAKDYLEKNLNLKSFYHTL